MKIGKSFVTRNVFEQKNLVTFIIQVVFQISKNSLQIFTTQNAIH